MNNNDQELIEDYFKGHVKSLDILIAKYLDVVYRLAFYYLKNETEAEDLTQEVFIKVWRYLKKFDRSKSFKNWVLAITKNTALDFLKKKKDLPLAALNEKQANDLLLDLVSVEAAPNDLLDFNIQIANVQKMLNSNPDYWHIFNMHNINGLSFREIANKLKKPLNTVKSQYRRAIIVIKNSTK